MLSSIFKSIRIAASELSSCQRTNRRTYRTPQQSNDVKADKDKKYSRKGKYDSKQRSSETKTKKRNSVTKRVRRTSRKYICIAAGFLAPATAAIANWDINYKSFTTDFTPSVADEITLLYEIGTDRVYEIDLFDKGCESPIDITINPTPNRTIGITADLDELEIKLDFDKALVRESNIWSEVLNGANNLEFCVRLQLRASNGEVMTIDERDIDIEFDFVVDLDVESVSMGSPSLTPKKESASANAESFITACKCDDFDSFACNTNALGPSDILYICIMSLDSEVKIGVIRNIILFQGDSQDNETLQVIESSQIQNTDVSSTTYKNNTAAGIETAVPARFFQTNGASTMISGEVLVDFARRSLVATGCEVRRLASKDLASPRALRGETFLGKGVARPGYHGASASPTSVDHPAKTNTNSQGSKRTSSFEIMVGLITEIPRDEFEDFVDVHASPGSVKMVVATHFLGLTTICFVWAFL